MPQMAPIWWTTMFILFLLTFIIMCTINYYNKINNPPILTVNDKMLKKTNWKW